MREQLILFVLLAAIPVWPQVAPSASGGNSVSPMMVPPPVSNVNYPASVGSEVHSNYLRGGFTESTAYISNLYAGSGGPSLAETTISILSSIALDATTTRQHMTVAFAPGYTFYSPSSILNSPDDSATAAYSVQLTPHTTFSANDQFQYSSMPIYNPAGVVSGGQVSGSPALSTPGVIAPFAPFLNNNANADFTAQTGMNTMLGGSGSLGTLHYPNSSETAGLYDYSSRGGSAFYNQRVLDRQYFGATYQYADILSYPTGETSTTQMQSVMGYYTIYAKSKLSFSILAGPQYYETSLPPIPVLSGWGPSVTASTGWQGMRTSLSASYSQSVTGGGGLLGAYHSKSANATARWQMSRTWTGNVDGAYSIIKSVSPQFALFGVENGHTVSGDMMAAHSMGAHWNISFSYVHIHLSYGNIAALSSNPDSDSGTVTIAWQFSRPLGK